MAYSKTYQRIIPVEDGVDDATLVWLVSESFYRKADDDGLVLTEFRDDGEVDPSDIPPRVDKQIGRPADSLRWRKFSGVGVRA